MSFDLSQKTGTLLDNIKSMTGHEVLFLAAGEIPSPDAIQWIVNGDEGEDYGKLVVDTLSTELTPEHEMLYLQLGHLLGHELDLRRQNLSLEQRFRLLDSQNAELAALNRALAEMAYRDPLTNLFRRWYLIEQSRLEMTRAIRYGRGFSLLMIDLDRFKEVNDTHGHAAGDVVLQGVARIMVQSCRTSDILSRFGGDEFCILLTDTPEEGAVEVAERIRRRCEEEKFTFRDWQLGITTSIGIGSYTAANLTGLTVEELLEQVDKSMYAAKKSGRNRLEVLTRIVA